jgi:hypothetical protein
MRHALVQVTTAARWCFAMKICGIIQASEAGFPAFYR